MKLKDAPICEKCGQTKDRATIVILGQFVEFWMCECEARKKWINYVYCEE